MANVYSCEEAVIQLDSKASLLIAIETDVNSDTLLCLPNDSMTIFGEEEIQLLEGCSYEYELHEGYAIKPIPYILRPSRRNTNRGRITPGNYVGRLTLKIISDNNTEIETAVEVRSVKEDYRTEYRKMLEDITAECTELLMIHSSPVSQRFAVNFEGDSETLYQRFAFVESIVDSDDFRNAVQRVISMPVTVWTSNSEEQDIRRLKKIRPKHLRQMASRNPRIRLPENNQLHTLMTTVPRRLTSEIKKDTVDTPENRFIKHTLMEFERFCGTVCRNIEEHKEETASKPNIYYEAKNLEARFSEYLSHNIFREISIPSTLPLNSPVLQRKEGYREIFRVWLMYDLAAKLTWDILDNDTYYAGKRDVAALYEYWLFFKLLRLIEEIFEVDPKETKELIKPTSDGLGLQLKAGQPEIIEGSYNHKNRDLIIKFHYNRTFSSSEYPNGGSWTQQMRPDYTLSIWPKGFSEKEAEKQELIVHVHFDAKYKVDDLQYLVLSDDMEISKEESIKMLNIEKEKEKQGSYKRADLLKMHAYKDAIRRTVGAYVLYPGTKLVRNKGFHEIVPGLGAFPVSPSNNGEGLEDIRSFIYEVLDHVSNRASQRESHSYQTYKIMRGKPHDLINESIPEYSISQEKRKERTLPPREVQVLVGYVQSKQKDWLKNNSLYNIRLDQEVTPAMAGAKYLLLFDSIRGDKTLNLWENGLYEIIDFPRIESADWLKEKDYFNPSKPEYFIYPIVGDTVGWSKDRIRKIRKPENLDDYRPFTLSLSELLEK